MPRTIRTLVAALPAPLRLKLDVRSLVDKIVIGAFVLVLCVIMTLWLGFLGWAAGLLFGLW